MGQLRPMEQAGIRMTAAGSQKGKDERNNKEFFYERLGRNVKIS